MKNNNVILASAAALVSVIAVSGVAFSTFAATSTDATNSDTVNQTATKQDRSRGGFMGIQLTDEQKAEMEAKRAENEADREARQVEMETAIQSGYDAWVALVTKQNADAPILDSITADNFSRFTEAHNLMSQGRDLIEQGKTIMKDELGVEQGHMGGKMHGGEGFDKGGHGRGMMDNSKTGTTAPAVQ